MFLIQYFLKLCFFSCFFYTNKRRDTNVTCTTAVFLVCALECITVILTQLQDIVFAGDQSALGSHQ